jgi:hypothetical protein
MAAFMRMMRQREEDVQTRNASMLTKAAKTMLKAAKKILCVLSGCPVVHLVQRCA